MSSRPEDQVTLGDLMSPLVWSKSDDRSGSSCLYFSICLAELLQWWVCGQTLVINSLCDLFYKWSGKQNEKNDPPIIVIFWQNQNLCFYLVISYQNILMIRQLDVARNRQQWDSVSFTTCIYYNKNNHGENVSKN